MEKNEIISLMENKRHHIGSTIRPDTDVIRQAIASQIVEELGDQGYIGKVRLDIVGGGVICTMPAMTSCTDRKLLKSVRPYLPSKKWSGSVIIHSHSSSSRPAWEFIGSK